MKKISKIVAGYATVLFFSLSLSGCSLFSQTSEAAGDGLSKVNPFSQQQAAPAPVASQPEQAAPVAKPLEQEAPKPSIRVEAAPAAPADQKKSGVAVNLGDNKQCTTFCALPMHRKPAQYAT